MRWIGVLFAAAIASSPAACAQQVETDAGDDEGELRTARLTPTRSIGAKADPTLVAAIRHFEARGGSGGWFRSVLPFEGATPEYYYFVRSVPPGADAAAPVLLLRLEHSRAALESAIRGGTPIVIGRVPAQHQAAAAAFTELPIAADALAAASIAGKKSVLFLPPETLRTTLAHELQHFEDFEDPTFQPRFDELAKPLMDAPYLSEDEKADLGQIVIELRGHGRGERQALEDLEKGNPALLRGGVPVTPAEARAAYEGDAANQVNVFMSSYRPVLRRIAAKVKAESTADHAALLRLIDAFNVARDGSRLRDLLR